MSDLTMGDVAKMAQDAAPGSIRIGNKILTYVGTYEYETEWPDALDD